jgi:hypothetical protein
MVRAFAAHAEAMPWAWGPQMLDEWLGELRGVKGLRRLTVRSYASSVSAFCRYVTDPAYGWADQCQAQFGTYPVQVVHEWNTAVHVQASEADPRKRAFTLDELQSLFDHADAQVGRVRGDGRKSMCLTSSSRTRTASGAPPRSCVRESGQWVMGRARKLRSPTCALRWKLCSPRSALPMS